MEEDAETLHLGDLQSERCLTNAEVSLILEHRMSSVGMVVKPTTTKALEYVRRSSQHRSKQVATCVREELAKLDFLTEFEAAQLANISPLDAEEALCLVPSLRAEALGEALGEERSAPVDRQRLGEVLERIHELRQV